MGQMALLSKVLSVVLKWMWFMSVKDAPSSGASPKIVQYTGEELCSKLIWWLIISGYTTSHRFPQAL